MNRRLFSALSQRLDLGAAKPDAKGWIKIRSPLREDRNPSFSIRPDDADGGAWRDHSTGEGGSLLDLCQRLGVEPPDAPGAVIEKPAPPRPMPWARWAALRSLDPDLVATLFGITGTTSIRFPTPCGVDRIRGLTDGKSRPKWARRGGAACAYGLAESFGLEGPIYLVEGEPSVWSCVQSGVPAVCTMMGINGVDQIATTLRDDGRHVVVAFDADDAGRRGAAEALKHLRAAGVEARAVALPERWRGFDVDDLHSAVGDDGLREALADLPPFEPDAPKRRPPSTPAPDLPDCYAINGAGALIRIVEDPKGKRDPSEVFVAECRIDVVRVGVDVDTGEHVWRLSWRSQSLDVPRADLAASRTLIPWSGQGLPVDQETARELVRYLTAYERDRRSEIPAHRSSTSSGWYGSAFLAGRTRIGDAAPHYRDGDPGRDPFAEAVAPRGSADVWRDTVQRAIERPVVRALVCASLASTLTQRAGLDAAIVDVAGTTSQGKTSALRVALSCLGDPWRLLHTWDTTRIAVERTASFSRGLSLAYDDTMRARRIEDVAGACYDVASGVARARGSRSGGLQASPPSHSWILSTGEGPLIRMAHGLGGLRARVLTITRPTWGGTSPDLGAEIRSILATLREHHGHALAPVVRILAGLDVAEIRARHAAIVDLHASRIYAATPGHPVGDRVSQYLASLELAGQILGEATGLRVSGPWIDPALADAIAAQAATADRAIDALHDVASAALVMRARLCTSPHDTPHPMGWIGAANFAEDDEIESLALDPGFVRDQLRRQGHEPGTVIASWAERGWLHCGPGSTTRKVRISGGRPRMYVLAPQALTLLQSA